MAQTDNNLEHLRARIFDAIDLRYILIPSEDNGGRLINGNGDNLEGLIVDRYDNYLLIEITNSTMWRLKEDIIATLTEAIEPSGILIKEKMALSDKSVAECPIDTIHGQEPSRQTISSGGLLYSIDLKKDTIHFFDQSDNRHSFGQMVKGYRVLDTFCYSGAWGLEAAKGGAKDVTFVDSDANAIALTEFNWKLNELKISYSAVTSKTINFMKRCKREGRKFDAIVIDPPLTVDSLDKIIKLNSLAIEILHRGGLLVSSSYLPQTTFDSLSMMIGRSAAKADKFARIIKFGHQSSSFPVAADFPESSYLKCLFARIY
jgi:23S rRNA (cytosine1962-C5)-methyltransferase